MLHSRNTDLTLDFTNASTDVQDVHTLLQSLLDKFFPNTHWLYHEGNSCADVSGGYEALAITQKGWSGATVVAPTFSLNNDNMYIALSVSGRSGAVFTKNLVDLTGFTKLKIKHSCTLSHSADVIYIHLTKTKSNGYSYAKQLMLTAGADIEQTLDISSLSGEYYVSIDIYSTSTNMSVVVKDIWLE